MFFRQDILKGEVEHLAGKLLAVKELVYYALCRPDEFRQWVETALNAEEKESLLSISTRLRNAVMFDETVSSGADVNGLRSEIFYLELVVKNEMTAFRLLIDRLLSTDERLSEGGNLLKKQAAELDTLLLARKKILDEHTGADWRALKPLMQGYLQSLLAQTTDIMISQNETIFKLGECGLSDSCVSTLRNQQQRLLGKLTALFEMQIASERVAVNLDHLNNMQTAVTNLMGNTGEQQAGVDWFVSLLERNYIYKRMLSNTMSSLRLFQKKFVDYLAAKELGKPLFTASAEDEIEDRKMQAFKTQASKLYAFRTGKEMVWAETLRFQEKQKVENAFKAACALYDEGNFKPALFGFLWGVKSMHAASYFNVGTMLMNGQGCDRDPVMARYYFWAAYGLEDVERNRMPYQVAAMQADKESIAFVEQVTPENQDINAAIEAAVLDDDDIMKWIFKSRESVMERLCRLGGLSITMLDMRETNIPALNRELLDSALYYFHWSYRYINDVYNRKNIISPRDEWLCQQLQKKIIELKREIVWYLDRVCDNDNHKDLLPMIDAFYKLYPFKEELAPRGRLSF